MILAGDVFALGLIAILCLFYFKNKYFPTAASKFYSWCLICTAVNASVDILSTYFINNQIGPVWLNMIINTVYFLTNILTSSFIAMLFFAKILEHVHDDHCMKKAITSLIATASAYASLVLTNPLTKILFYFDENGVYTRGPLNFLGYLVVIVQVIFVAICYFRNRKYVTKNMKFAVIQILPITVLFIFVQLTYPEILLNSLIMALVELVFYLHLHSNASGVHTLTNLNDRHKFVRYVDDLIRADKSFTTFVVSIKSFESLNQKYGHLLGDEIIYLFAFALEKEMKSNAVFHLDNLYFAINVSSTERAELDNTLEKIHAFMNGGIVIKDEVIKLDYAVFEHTLPENCTDAGIFYEQLEYGIDIADGEGAKYFVYTPELTERMMRRRYLIGRLENISREGGFEVWFQPVYCLEKGVFCSMEALVRLRETDGSLISPGEFIPIAEDADMIVPITWFVLEEACKIISENDALNGITVSVNIPMVQLVDREFVCHLNEIVDKYGVAHSQICLEFTERVMLDDFKRVKECMDGVSECGYRFFLDDFGTGFSNFNCLLQLPFCDVKLDKSLTDTLAADAPEVNIVKTLVDLFHNMNLKVIAEGVETAEQVEILKTYGIDRIQGFYYSAPMNIDKLLAFYKRNPMN